MTVQVAHGVGALALDIDLRIARGAAPGLESGMEVNVVAEIMAPRPGTDRLRRHLTPWLSVPNVGPFDNFEDASSLAIKIEWKSPSGQWKTCAVGQPQIFMAAATVTMNEGITTEQYGVEVDGFGLDEGYEADCNAYEMGLRL